MNIFEYLYEHRDELPDFEIPQWRGIEYSTNMSFLSRDKAIILHIEFEDIGPSCGDREELPIHTTLSLTEEPWECLDDETYDGSSNSYPFILGRIQYFLIILRKVIDLTSK